MFNWVVDAGLVEPSADIEAKGLHGAALKRDRVLTDDELRRVWRAAEKLRAPEAGQAAGDPYGALVCSLILTGQRRDEVSKSRWPEYDKVDPDEADRDDALLTVPGERMKAGITHAVPLVRTVLPILDALPRFEGGDYVFTTTGGKKPISSWSKNKKRPDKTIGEIAPWTLHDLRRTMRIGMSTAGVLPFIGELVIAHAQSGVHAVYDLHKYDAEKREALGDQASIDCRATSRAGPE
jgi:integrase